MKFTLTYDGSLPPSANKSKTKDVWRIRQEIAPQLQELWTTHPGLAHETVDLCRPIEKHGAWFVPLVRETFALHCGLKVLFLRQEDKGRVYQGGDLDGRLKTLLDALSIPQHSEQVLGKESTEAQPILCLMEDDSMISSLDIQSERLLVGGNNPKDYVRLVIEVDVRARESSMNVPVR